MTNLIWENEYSIYSFYCDSKKQITIPALCGLIQETAVEHAEKTGIGISDMAKEKKLWVISRIKIKIEKYPKWGERIKIKTWIDERIDNIFTYRNFKVLNEKENVIAIAVISWAMIDLERRRAVPIKKRIEEMNITSEEKIFEQLPDKIPPIKETTETTKRTVLFSDIDFVGHMNNLKYIEWILSNYPAEIYKENEIELMEINFMAEALYNDEINIINDYSASNYKLHSLKRIKDNTEICRMRTMWKN